MQCNAMRHVSNLVCKKDVEKCGCSKKQLLLLTLVYCHGGGGEQATLRRIICVALRKRILLDYVLLPMAVISVPAYICMLYSTVLVLDHANAARIVINTSIIIRI